MLSVEQKTKGLCGCKKMKNAVVNSNTFICNTCNELFFYDVQNLKCSKNKIKDTNLFKHGRHYTRQILFPEKRTL
jgi:hypothetical protein